MVSSAVELAGLAPSMVNEPVNSPKVPRTLATIAWRVLKARLVWVGSMTQVPVAAARPVVSVAVLLMSAPVRWLWG